MSASAFDIYCELDGRLDGSISCDEPMSRHVTYRLGGTADLFVECATVADLMLVIHTLTSYEMPWTVIGQGSNLLVSDGGVRKAIIVLGKEFKKYVIGDDGVFTAGAGLPLATLVQNAFKNGYSGFEFAVGIPGTLGGAICMNAGTRSEWIGSIVNAVTVLNVDEGLVRRKGHEISWTYRRSGIGADDIVLEAELRTTPGDIGQIRAKMEAGLTRRKRSQPLSLPNAGSIFKNPEGHSAGKLIEDVGLKGETIGGAQISTLHANFIVNQGNATAQDVLGLIALARERVKEVYGIELQPEVRFLGFERS